MNTIKNNTKSRPGLLNRRWLQVVIGLAVLLGLLVILTPYLMAWLAQDWLLENGADKVEIRDIDFNPFTGIVVVDQLKVQVQDRDSLVIPSFVLDLDWSPLFSRRAHVSTVTIDGVHLTVEALADGGIRIGGVSYSSQN